MYWGCVQFITASISGVSPSRFRALTFPPWRRARSGRAGLDAGLDPGLDTEATPDRARTDPGSTSDRPRIPPRSQPRNRPQNRRGFAPGSIPNRSQIDPGTTPIETTGGRPKPDGEGGQEADANRVTGLPANPSLALPTANQVSDAQGGPGSLGHQRPTLSRRSTQAATGSGFRPMEAPQKRHGGGGQGRRKRPTGLLTPTSCIPHHSLLSKAPASVAANRAEAMRLAPKFGRTPPRLTSRKPPGTTTNDDHVAPTASRNTRGRDLLRRRATPKTPIMGGTPPRDDNE